MNKKTGVTLKDWEKMRGKDPDYVIKCLEKYGISKELWPVMAMEFWQWDQRQPENAQLS